MSRSKNFTAIVLAAIAFAAATGCQKANDKNAAAAQPGNKAAVTVTQSGVVTPHNETSDSLASPSDAYRTAYDARKNKDIPTLKHVISRDLLDYLTRMGQANNSKRQTIDEVLQELCDRPQAPNGDIRNENVMGDVGSVQYQDETGKWRVMDFVKENGEWKLALRKRGENPVEIPAK